MNKATTFQEYVFGEVDDTARLTLQHTIFKPSFISAVDTILDKYGLANRLQLALSSGHKIRILDAGCGEGLYLYDLAEILHKRNLLAAADLNGIDVDTKAIVNADQLGGVLNLPYPSPNFYVWDVTQPLDDCLGLRQEGEVTFDLIFGISLMTHLSGAREYLEKLYSFLKPGGIIYLRDVELDIEVAASRTPHPALLPFSLMLINLLLGINKGIKVSQEQAGWLKEMGADEVEAYPVNFQIGGESTTGMQMLRRLVMLFRNTAPMLISRGFMTQAQFDQTMATVYRELSPASQGQETWIDTLARKPALAK